jgi:hypothetical protein
VCLFHVVVLVDRGLDQLAATLEQATDKSRTPTTLDEHVFDSS